MADKDLSSASYVAEPSRLIQVIPIPCEKDLLEAELWVDEESG